MKKSRDPLSYSQLWAVRWLTGTLLIVQLIAGVIVAYTLSAGATRDNLWMGGALSMVPGFALGLLVQYKVDPAKLSENKLTVGVLGLIALVVFGFAVARATGSIHAG